MMDNKELFAHIERLKQTVHQSRRAGSSLKGAQAQVVEFLREFAGSKSSFLQTAQNAGGGPEYTADSLIAILDGFKTHVEAGLQNKVNMVRRAQLDVVSDFLDQAHGLIELKGVHPAAPIVLIGATLEEFLRTWIEDAGLSLGQRKPSLDTYAHVLHAENLITKQDVKDITAWAGLRNHAAHGDWSMVSDKQRAAVMLDGVNLFMRKYGA